MIKVINFIIFTLLSQSIYASATLTKDGAYELYTSINFYQTSDSFNNKSKSEKYPNNGSFKKYELSYYYLYGLSNTTSLLVKGNILTDLSYKDDFNQLDNTQIGENAIGIKKHIKKYKHGTSAWMATISFPLFDKEKAPKPAAHQSDLEIRYLHDIYSAFKLDFISIESGVNFRLGIPVNQFKLDITIGKWFNNFLPMFHSYFVKSLDESNSNLTNSPLDAQDWDQWKIGPSLAYKLSRTYSIQLGYLNEVWGRNIGNGHSIFISLWCN